MCLLLIFFIFTPNVEIITFFRVFFFFPVPFEKVVVSVQSPN